MQPGPQPTPPPEGDPASCEILAPCSGVLVPLDSLPDPVFAGRLVGDGVAIDPTSPVLLAPCAGKVALLHPSRHALTLIAANGAPLLMHVGLDTVTLRGEGFRALVRAGDLVKAGQPLLEFDIDTLARKARSLLTPIVVADTSGEFTLIPTRGELVEAGKTVILRIARNQAAPVTAAAETHAAETVTGRSVTIADAVGLHARPGARLAARAKGFRSDLRLLAHGAEANAKSLVSLLGLGLRRGDAVRVRAAGPDAGEAVEAITRLLEHREEEQPPSPRPPPAPVASHDLRILRGVPAAPGLAVGRIFHFRRKPIDIPESGESVEDERRRLTEALDRARHELDELRAALTDPCHCEILGAHREMLDDPALLGPAHEGIRAGKSAAFAWKSAFSGHAERLEAVESPLLRERAGDIRDVGMRVLALITGRRRERIDAPEGSILIAEDLTPSDAAGLDRTKILGFCTVSGGAAGHVAILARAFGMPAVCGAPPLLSALPEGAAVVLDGHAGTLHTGPTEEELAAAHARIAEQKQRCACDLANARSHVHTRDGLPVFVGANVRNAAEAREAAEIGADCVGLLRTEFLFDARETPPSEDEQAAAYTECAQALGPCRPLIIRTLDAGGDKPLPFLPLPSESNPFLGLRGIRVGLANPGLLRTQLRAILRAAPHGDVRVMFPMIATPDEFREAKAMLDEESRAMGVSVETGLMIEVPAAALLADIFAREADFLSLGTNDLTQYTLAMDRGHPLLSARADALSPSVLRLVEMSAIAARRHGRLLAACGALAADPDATPLLIGLGVRELSVPAPDIPRVKAAVKRLSLEECQALALRALECDDAKAVRALVAGAAGAPG